MEIIQNTNEITVKTKSDDLITIRKTNVLGALVYTVIDGGYVGCFNTAAEALDVVVHSSTLQKHPEDVIKFWLFLNGK